ncbi:MAG TPA: bifunctional demethylmenaquinone methyltransferase/2-methoxy-6-polyprenyl-1,4-benzoquinol methylase UbiE [Chthoniobacterales bacterium]|nr:bifunctional demethylmenaquinone methyltransferase/2-methoxy-6-polyprenyl-1,4-benzoquinol methylase UbiE [Chthoniobacterales bacterium]
MASQAPGADVSRDPDSVRAMFGRIARRYDLANHLLSGGADFLWRRRAANIVGEWRPRDVLDLATGSGDLALAIQRRCPAGKVVAADFSPEMLEIARRKGVANTVLADALQLPFESASFDCVTVAFGLRNMADWDRALVEMARVLRPGGHLLVLDFSIPTGAFRPVYRFYLHGILPSLASIVTGQKAAYDYLGGSIEKFPSDQPMLDLIERNGFTNAIAEPLTGGIATIYTAAL